MIGKPFDQLGESELASLVTNRVTEGRSLEFKRELPGGSDADLKEFLADVTSLANAQGGDLVFGIEDEDGTATALLGMTVDDIDAAMLRLENILRDGVEPRISGVRLRWISLSSGKGALVLRVPGSLAAPHRLRFRNSGRFYTRNSRGKYEMDTHELRVAFTASDQMPTRLRQLHAAAVATAKHESFPFKLRGEPTAVVSIMPLTFFREMRDLQLTPENVPVPPRVSGGLNHLHTLEGILFTTPLGEDNAVRSYALTHRTGRVDAAWSIGGAREHQGKEMKLVFPKYFRDGILDIARAASTRLQMFGLEGPWVIFVTVYGSRGYQIFLDNYYQSDPAWRDEAGFPEIVAENLTEESLQPLFDAFPLLFGIPATEYRYPS